MAGQTQSYGRSSGSLSASANYVKAQSTNGQSSPGQKKDSRARHARFNARKPISGPGLFVTCARGREGRCIGEMYDLLDDMAEKLYPPERLARYESIRESSNVSTLNKVSLDNNSGAIVLDVDDEDDDQSIEASIAKELAALSSSRTARKPSKTSPGDLASEEVNGKRSKPRFSSIDTDTECLVYVKIRWPYDPVELAHGIVKSVQETGISRTRYTNKLQPVAFVCPALNIDEVSSKSRGLIEEIFGLWSRVNLTTSVTYQIEPTVRSHIKPLNRAVLIDLLGTAVRSLSDDLPTAVPSMGRPKLDVKANLTTPDLVLVPLVLKNVYGLSIVEGKSWYGNLGRKWNLDMIGVEARRTEEHKG